MTSNFEFLKNKDKKLFNIIEDTERLYRDGYFEQTIAQTRKFAENICKNTLGVRRTTEETFDDMLGTLKDILGENPSDKEFIDDMYFLKKQGNLAVHGSALELGGNVALECLQRAFEVSINYAIKNKWANKKIINSNYSIDLLMTGRHYKFGEQYQKIREAEDAEGIQEIVKRAEAEDKKDFKEKKVTEVDFKNKKRIKDKKQKNTAKSTPKKDTKQKPSKKEKNKIPVSEKSDILFYAVIFGVLFIFMIAILIFILPF